MSDDRAEQAFRDAFAQHVDRLEPDPLPVVRRRRRWPALVVAAAVVALVGGGLVVGSQPPDPPDDAPVLGTEAAVPLSPGMTVTPDVATPGQVVSVTYRTDWTRGIGYQLARPDRPDAPDYVMGASDESAHWMSTDDEYGFEDIGVTGLGPDRVQVPDDIDAGEWVLCTANARPQRCTSLTVPEEGVAPRPVTEVPPREGPLVMVLIDPTGSFLTVKSLGSSTCKNLVTSVDVLDEETLVVRTSGALRHPDGPCSATQTSGRDTWPLVGDQAQHASYAVVTTGGSDEGVRTEIVVGTPKAE
jgi:hypothetical protein